MPDNKKDGKSSLLKRLSGSKGKNKVDIPTIIFFSILIVGAIVITIIIMQKPHSKIYSKAFGDKLIHEDSKKKISFRTIEAFTRYFPNISKYQVI